MSQIFKVSLLDNDKSIKKIYAFVSSRFEHRSGVTGQISDLFRENPKHKIFSLIFTEHERDIIAEENIDVIFIKESLYLDDTLGAIKLKLLEALDQNISIEEMYLFTTINKILNPVKVYDILTQNNKLELTRDRMIQFLSNINLDISGLETKEVYDYNDILGLDLQKQAVIVKEPVGQKFFVIEGKYLYTVNPFDVLVYDEFLEKYADNTITTLNADLVLDSLPVENNMLYLCLAEDVYNYAAISGLSPVTTTKIYYPFLLQKGITGAEELAAQKYQLAESSKKLLTSKMLAQFKNVSLFYNIYDERTTELNYLEYGVNYANFVIHPPYKFNLPLDTIFKLIHATQTVPLIKYNPGPRQEKIYKLYTSQIAKNGKKIPYLSKGTIFRLMRTIGKNKKVSVYTEHLYHDSNVPVICDFSSDGTIQTIVEFKQAHTREICEDILRNTVNPIIETVRDFLEQSGYEMALFENFSKSNIEIISMRYFAQLSITKNIHVDRYIGCLSSMFNVLESDLKTGILMRYKRVANYNEMDNITAFMTEQIKIGVSDTELVENLIHNFKLTADEARQKLVTLLNEFQVEQGLYENKRLRIRNNPGFPTKIIQDKFKNNIFIEVDNIDDIYYLDTIPIYLDSLIRITQNIDSTGVPKEEISQLCNAGVQPDVVVIDDIVAPAEHPLESNFSPSIIAAELQFELTPAADSDNMDDLMDFMGMDSDGEEEEEEAESGSPMQTNTFRDPSPPVKSGVVPAPTGPSLLPESIVAEISVPVSRTSSVESAVDDDLLSQTLRIGLSSKKGGSTGSSTPESVVDDDLMDLLDFVPESEESEEVGPIGSSAPQAAALIENAIQEEDSTASHVEPEPVAEADVSPSLEEELPGPSDSLSSATTTSPDTPDVKILMDQEAAEEEKEEKEAVAEEADQEAEEEEAEEEEEKEAVAEEADQEAEEEEEDAEEAEEEAVAEKEEAVAEEEEAVAEEAVAEDQEEVIDQREWVEIPIVDVSDSSSEDAPVLTQASNLSSEKSEEESDLRPKLLPSTEQEQTPQSLKSGSDIEGKDIEQLVSELSQKVAEERSEVDDVAEDEDDFVQNIDGMSLSNPNPIFTKLHDHDPTLFLTQDVGNFKQYSRACPWNVRRQPILLTEKEKENIDKNHPGSYENAIKYGSDPENQYYYICPRYWCLLNNTSLTEEDVKQGKCGGQVIPRGAKKVPAGKYIIEFNHPSEHIDEEGNYIPHHPGFLKNTNPDGKCIPCCFKNWNAPEQHKRREECANDRGERIQRVPSQREIDHYVKSADKIPLEPSRWGYLPVSVQKFLYTDNLKCQVSHNNHNVKPFYTCILRHGVEISETQSFIACIADLFVDYIEGDAVPTIGEMKRYIAEAVTFDDFSTYQNGTLISEFRDKDNDDIEDTDIDPYSHTRTAYSLDLKEGKDLFYFKERVSAYDNFIKFMQDDDIIINYTYLWDIICTPNKLLFPKGLNLVILQQTNYDITDNIEIICPSNHYANTFYEVGKGTFIILKSENYYEPIYAYRDDESRLLVIKTFNEFSNQLLPNIRNVLGVIKKIYKQNCRPLPSMPRTYKFRTNIILPDLMKKLGSLSYIVHNQVLNYQGKVIGVMVGDEDSARGFIPCFPSAINLSIPYIYMDNPAIWHSYRDTIAFLLEVNEKSKGGVLSKPIIKVIDDGLIVGIITETNQFIEVDPPNENIVDDGLHVINSSNFLVADKVAETDASSDLERKLVIKHIELESNFYNVFRNSIRILLNDPKNRVLRGKIEETIDTDYLIYSEKLRIVDKKLRELGNRYITFTDYDPRILDNITNITGCIGNSEDKCRGKPYCMIKSDTDCNLLIPKNHLITNLNNEKIYYGRLADEIIRYSRIRHFIFEPKEFLNFDVVNYNLWPTEIILLQIFTESGIF